MPSEVGAALVEILAAMLLARMVAEGQGGIKSYRSAKAEPRIRHLRAPSMRARQKVEPLNASS
jgi:hypothetical protein